jgi:RNA polymerase sigma-70 factor (ECF subfamily)
MVRDAAGRLINVLALEVADDAVRAIYAIVNPEKLRHLGPLSDLTRPRAKYMDPLARTPAGRG